MAFTITILLLLGREVFCILVQMWFKSLDLSDEGKRSSRILPNNPLVCFLDAVYRTKLSRSSCSSKIVSLPEDRYLYKMTSKQ